MRGSEVRGEVRGEGRHLGDPLTEGAGGEGLLAAHRDLQGGQ